MSDSTCYCVFLFPQPNSVIRPGVNWWEGSSEVVSFIPPQPEPSVEDTVREKLGTEFNFTLGKQVEELVTNIWEDMRKEG